MPEALAHGFCGSELAHEDAQHSEHLERLKDSCRNQAHSHSHARSYSWAASSGAEAFCKCPCNNLNAGTSSA